MSTEDLGVITLHDNQLARKALKNRYKKLKNDGVEDIDMTVFKVNQVENFEISIIRTIIRFGAYVPFMLLSHLKLIKVSTEAFVTALKRVSRLAKKPETLILPENPQIKQALETRQKGLPDDQSGSTDFLEKRLIAELLQTNSYDPTYLYTEQLKSNFDVSNLLEAVDRIQKMTSQ